MGATFPLNIAKHYTSANIVYNEIVYLPPLTNPKTIYHIIVVAVVCCCCYLITVYPSIQADTHTHSKAAPCFSRYAIHLALWRALRLL